MPEPTQPTLKELEAEAAELSIDFSDLEKKYQVEPESGLECYVVIDGAPIIPEAKVPMLTKVLKKLFSSCGKIVEDGFYMPLEDGKTKGFVFLEYENPAMANEAIKTYNNKKLDPKHTLRVNRLADIERFGFEGNVLSEYHEPVIEPYQPRDHLRWWLTDPQGRDQMIIHKADTVGVYWNRRNGQPPEPVVERDQWTEKFARWSCKGTYLVSMHRQGVQLWGGENWTSFGRFAHPGVALVDFSPNEEYMVTWSPIPINLPPLGDPARARIPFKDSDIGNQIAVWDVKTLLPLRSFPMLTPPDKENLDKVIWPMFKWSADSKYLARVVPGEAIAVYETPGMGLFEKKSIKIAGIVDFEFAPALVKLEGSKLPEGVAGEQLICYWTPEMPNQTARVCIMTLPGKKIIRSRNLFSVSGCRMHWQDQGKFLCVKVDRHTKSKKSIYTNLEFFRVAEKDIPVEVIELKDSQVINFQWEPKRDRFVMISVKEAPPGVAGVSPVPKSILSFYSLEKNKGSQGTWKPVTAFENKAGVNSIYWSPTGRFVITATVRMSSTSELEFWDLDYEGEKKIYDKELEVNLFSVGTCEHFGMTDVEWDPSGRYLATSSSSWKHRLENGYKLWDLRGQLLREDSIDNFKELRWRPRPASILPKQKRKEVNKNLKTYARQFEEEDAMEASEASREIILRRRKALADWREWRAAVEDKLHSLGLLTEVELVQSEDADELIEEIKEEIIEEKEEEIE